MIKELISVLMDDYKDSSMLVDYTEEAMELGDKELASFFANRAKHRMADAREAERRIDDLGGTDKVHEAYKEYHDEQCARLKRKLDRLM